MEVTISAFISQYNSWQAVMTPLFVSHYEEGSVIQWALEDPSEH